MSTLPSSSPRLESLLSQALELGADDIYLQSQGSETSLRYRVSGFMVDAPQSKITDFPELLAEIKAHLEEDETSDEDEWYGQFSLLVEDRTVWIQALWIREQNSESLGLRIVSRWLGFTDLGLSSQDAAILDELIAHPHGVIVGCAETLAGHATTLNALLERLAQGGKRIASLADMPDPLLKGVTQLDAPNEDFAEQIEMLAGHFEVVALGNLSSPEKVRAAFDLAADGHLVLGLIYLPALGMAPRRLLDLGATPEEVRAHFLGGWAQTLVRRAASEERIGLFHCQRYEEAEAQETDSRALWHDAEEKIAQGLITREDAERQLGTAGRTKIE